LKEQLVKKTAELAAIILTSKIPAKVHAGLGEPACN
jgi:hypothetical protein